MTARLKPTVVERPDRFDEPAASLRGVPAVILCGGFGTRLRSVVANEPKSMAKIAGKPFLIYLLEWLRMSGIHDVVLCTGYKAEILREQLGDGSIYGLSLRHSSENEPLGTGGALKFAERFLDRGPFLVLNGDSVLDVNLTRMLSEHSRRTAKATIALAKPINHGRYGRVWTDKSGAVTAFVEKGVNELGQDPALPEWMNAGVYLFERDVLSLIPEAPPPVSLEIDLLPQLVGVGLYGFQSDSYFIDIGVPEDFLRAQEELPRRFQHVHSNSR